MAPRHSIERTASRTASSRTLSFYCRGLRRPASRMRIRGRHVTIPSHEPLRTPGRRRRPHPVRAEPHRAAPPRPRPFGAGRLEPGTRGRRPVPAPAGGHRRRPVPGRNGPTRRCTTSDGSASTGTGRSGCSRRTSPSIAGPSTRCGRAACSTPASAPAPTLSRPARRRTVPRTVPRCIPAPAAGSTRHDAPIASTPACRTRFASTWRQPAGRRGRSTGSRKGRGASPAIRNGSATWCWRARRCRPATTCASPTTTRSPGSPWSRAGSTCCPATDLHRLLQALLGWPAPAYAHHPLLCSPDGRRLAKRDGAASLSSLRAQKPGARPGPCHGRLRHARLRLSRQERDPSATARRSRSGSSFDRVMPYPPVSGGSRHARSAVPAALPGQHAGADSRPVGNARPAGRLRPT